MIRLIYHPESDSYFTGSADDLAKDGLLVDVTGEDDHELAAVLAGVDINEIDAEPGHLTGGDPTKYVIPSTGGLSGAIAASMAKWARKPADLYPTPPDCTYSLIPHVEEFLPAGSVILEPACADGQMSRALEEFGYEVISTDLRPDVAYGTGGIDFLAEDYEIPEGIDAVWTNPPFNAAALFIQRALEVAPVVVMLLKAQYWNTTNRKKLFRETKPWRIFSLTWRPAFLEAERGKSPLMDCIWVVWRRGHDDLPTMDILDRLMTCPLPEDSYGGL
jgi:hypothetical protein